MKQHIIRQYDIRGIVGRDFIIEDADAIMHAWLYDLQERNVVCQKIALGYDGRTHSYALFERLKEVAIMAGYEVIVLGLVPTPLVYHVLSEYVADVGIMVTASHNGPEYNGFKFSVGLLPYAGQDLIRLQTLVAKGARVLPKAGGLAKLYDGLTPYTRHMRSLFPELDGKPLPVVVDAGNGATGPVFQHWVDIGFILPEKLLLADIDSNWSTHGPDPVDINNTYYAAEHMKAAQALWAVLFDGDGDRMVALDHTGRPCGGDELLALWMSDIAIRYPHAVIICDAKASMVVELQAAKLHQRVVRAPSGHTHIKKAMRSNSALLGGELSCHFFFADEYHGCDDALYAFLRLARYLMQHADKNLHEHCNSLFPLYRISEQRVWCEENDKAAVMKLIETYCMNFFSNKYTFQRYDGIRAVSDSGWWLVRPSHTQPVLCLRAEGITATALDEHLKDLSAVLESAHISIVFNQE